MYKLVSKRKKKRVKGSLTVEAAIVMFFVSMLLACFLLLFPMLQKEMLHTKILTPVFRQGACMSVMAPETAGSFFTVAGNVALRKRYKENPPILLGVNYEEGTLIKVKLRRELPFPQMARLLIGKNIYYVRSWTGYRRSEDEDDYVYITKTGHVYHRNRSCYHLLITIKTVLKAKIESFRNQNGAKYYPCENCGKNAGEQVYITPEGNRYHSRKNCKNLLRFIHRVTLSSVKDSHRPCKNCSGDSGGETNGN